MKKKITYQRSLLIKIVLEKKVNIHLKSALRNLAPLIKK